MNTVKNLFFVLSLCALSDTWGMDNFVLTKEAEKFFANSNNKDFYSKAYSLREDLEYDYEIYIPTVEFCHKGNKPKGYIKVIKKQGNNCTDKIELDYVKEVPIKALNRITAEYSVKEIGYHFNGTFKKAFSIIEHAIVSTKFNSITVDTSAQNTKSPMEKTKNSTTIDSSAQNAKTSSKKLKKTSIMSKQTIKTPNLLYQSAFHKNNLCKHLADFNYRLISL